MVKLGDVCDILNGYAFKSDKYVDDGIRIIRISNVQKGFIEDNTPVFYPINDSEAKKYTLSCGDLLMSLTGNVGRVGIVTDELLPAALNQRVACFRVKDKNLLNKFYLYHMLNSDSFEQKCSGSAKGVAQKNMSTEWLKECAFELPPISMQHEIVCRLDKVSDLIALRKQQLAKLDELVKARFIELFGDPEYNSKGWPIRDLGELCSVGSSKRIYQNEQSSEGVPFWRISDLVSKMDTGTVDSDLFIPEEKYLELKNSNLVPTLGDILVTSRGTLGRCYIIKADDRFYFQDGMISWLSNYANGITPLYLQYLFTMSGFRKQIDSMQAGSTVAYLSIAMLKKLHVMVPDKEVQESFADFVTQTDKSKLEIQTALTKLETLKKALMQQYFG